MTRTRTLIAVVFTGATFCGCQLLGGFETFSPGGGADAAADGEAETSVDPDASEAAADVFAPSDADAAPDENDAPPPACGDTIPSSPDLAATVRACVLSTGCMPLGTFNVSISFCISYDYNLSNGSGGCVATVKTCADVAACTGTFIPTTSDCPSASTPQHCVTNNRAVDCVNMIGSDCTRTGGTCGTYTVAGDGGSPITVADCRVLSSCSETDGLYHCQGDLLYGCDQGQGYGLNCALINESCKVTDAGLGTNCYSSTTVPCTTPGNTCNGNQVNSCGGDLELFTYDCSKAGLTCSPGSGTCVAPYCTPADVAKCHESCAADGITASFCVGGAPFKVDCTKYGFTACAPYTSLGTTGVRCQ